MSNDLKYVLLPGVEDRRRPPKFQPWYRERIRMKYPCDMDTRNWKFVKDGLDDFRDGLPPPHNDLIIQSEKGPGPEIISEHRQIHATALDVRHRLKEHQIYFSRELPAVERRRQTIENYITMLLDHPLAFFSHFSQVLSPEDYERMTKLLEAELSSGDNEEKISMSDMQREHDSRLLQPSANTMRTETFRSENTLSEIRRDQSAIEKTTSSELSGDANAGRDQSAAPTVEVSETRSSVNRPGRNGVVFDEAGQPWNAEELEKKQKNPFRWYIDKQRAKQKAKGPSQEEQAASAMEARLRVVSEQFCTWLYDLGGEASVDIDPAVVRNLFSTAYDTKPSLSVPIKIVEMTRVPPELREGAQDSMMPESERKTGSRSTMQAGGPVNLRSRDGGSPVLNQDRHSQKYRYGAWYLPKNLWHRSLLTEELRDPKEIKAEKEDVTRKREEELNALLAPLHTINSFKEYLQKSGHTRLPRLITDVEKYRRDHANDANGSKTDGASKRPIR